MQVAIQKKDTCNHALRVSKCPTYDGTVAAATEVWILKKQQDAVVDLHCAEVLELGVSHGRQCCDDYEVDEMPQLIVRIQHLPEKHEDDIRVSTMRISENGLHVEEAQITLKPNESRQVALPDECFLQVQRIRSERSIAE